MANVLAAIGGAAAGIGNFLQQQREYNMQQVLMKAKLAELGATPNASSAPDPNDPNPTGGAGNGPSNPAAALMSGGAMPDVSAPPPSPSGPLAGGGNATQGGAVGSMAAPSTGNLTQSGVGPSVGNATQSGVSGIPTDQASVIAQARAAAGNGLQGGSASGANGGGVLAALSAAKAAPAMPAPGVSGTPTPADPVGGINSGLTGAVNDYVGAMRPTGKVDLGNGMTMPASIPPQQAQMLNALFEARKAAALQQSGFQQQTALQGSGQEFESGQNALSRAQQAGLAAEHEQLTRDLAKATNSVEYARIQAERDRNAAEMAMLTEGKSQAEMGKIDNDLKPIEQQLPAINKFQAITPEMAKSNPALAQQAIFGALQSGLGGATFQSRLAKVAGAAPTASIPQIAERMVTTLATGQRLPGSQFQALQQEVALNKATLRSQHAALLAQDLTQYPMAAKNPGIANRTTALFGPEPGAQEPQQNDPKYSKDMAGYKQYVQDHNAWQTTSSK